jgi:porphobilinogen deaminase
MKKIFFIYGESYHSWSERRADDHHSFSTAGIIEIAPKTDNKAILKDVKKSLIKSIAEREINDTLISGCKFGPGISSGTTGGSWKEFHGEFFSKNDSNQERVEELNKGLKELLPKIFKSNTK